MNIIESIKKARERGFSDEEILKLIIAQNPDKAKDFQILLNQGKSATFILEEIIKKKQKEIEEKEKVLQEKKESEPKPITPVSEKEEDEIQKAKERIMRLKEETEKKEVQPTPPYKPEIEQKTQPPLREEIKESEKPSLEEKEKREEVRKATIFRENFLQGLEKAKNKLLSAKTQPSLSQEKVQEKKPAETKKEGALPSFVSREKEIVRILPRRPTIRERLWFRVILVCILVVMLTGLATFWYWYFAVQPKPTPFVCSSDSDCEPGQICSPQGVCVNAPPIEECKTDADCPVGQICGPDKKCIKKEEKIVIPTPLFQADRERTLTISSLEEIKSLLSQIIEEWQEAGIFTRLIIEDKSEKKVVGLKEFFSALFVRMPEEFYEKLDNEFTLFMYSQTQGNRIGFVTKIKDYTGLEDMLRKEEPKLEQDLEPLFVLMGKKGSAVVPYFRDAINVPGYSGPNFRYKTLTKDDLGIVYLASGDYFIFTSSWKSMEEVAKKLAITGTRLEITKELKLGDRGYEVKLLQTWLAQDPTVYPQRIVSGFFGRLTKLAVIRFQEKYASDILAPQGLIKGTGVVDSYTRMKLNELYGDSGIKPRITELTTGLKLGDRGEEVKLLQTWLAKDPKIYPEKIISGYFGYLTQRALIRFQEKYADEILKPQGLTKGTGVVDALTRQKLNELFSKQ